MKVSHLVMQSNRNSKGSEKIRNSGGEEGLMIFRILRAWGVGGGESIVEFSKAREMGEGG